MSTAGSPSVRVPERPARPAYDSALARFEQDTIRSVNHEMRGRAADQVREVLVARFHDRLPGVDLDERNLDKIALAISNGSLPD
jgi:hypothetical protein